MSWGRGRGRGRGGFGGGFRGDFAKQEPFVIFPEIELPDPKLISKEPQLVTSYFNFQKFWKNSPYYLGDGAKKQENESLDIERYSDLLKPKNKTNMKGSFYDFLVLRPDNFPKDLLGDTRRERPVKKAKWSQNTELEKLNVFDRLIELEEKKKPGGVDDKDVEKEDEEDPEGEDEESDDDNGDYDQNQDFDDDDDDYNNQEDDGGDEEDFF